MIVKEYRRNRVRNVTIVVVCFVATFLSLFFGAQFVTQTGIFKVPGVVIYDESLNESEIAMLEQIFTEAVDLSRDVTISGRNELARPELAEGEFLSEIYVVVTDFYSNLDNVAIVTANEALADCTDCSYQVINLRNLTFDKKLLSINDEYFFDNFKSGAIFRVISFKSEAYAAEIAPLISESYEMIFDEDPSAMTSSALGGIGAENDVDQEIYQYYDFENSTLAEIVASFMDRHSLTVDNFSMSYVLSDQTLRYDVAGDVFREAASTYKVPLNMYYYDLENSGQTSPTARIYGYALDRIHRYSIVYSDNKMSEALFRNLGTFRHYRELMASYCNQEYPDIYYRENVISASYMTCILRHIYEHEQQYVQLIDYMKESAPGQYLKNNHTDVEIAHKYGMYASAVNDVGIVYTERPYFLAVFTSGVRDADSVIGELSALMTAYTNFHIRVNKKLYSEKMMSLEGTLRNWRSQERRMLDDGILSHKSALQLLRLICLVTSSIVVVFAASYVIFVKNRR